MQIIIGDEENPYFHSKQCYRKRYEYTLDILWHPEKIGGENCNGYIVQKVDVKCSIPGVGVADRPYFEAWKVTNGITGNSGYDDHFTCSDIENEGVITYNTEIYWIDITDDLFAEVSEWKSGEAFMANELPSTYDFPGIENRHPVFGRQYVYDNRGMTMKVPIDLNNKTILVTGSPGFIGANLVIRLLKEMSGGTVVSLDNMNDYYEVSLKEWRLAQVEKAAEDSSVKHVFVKGSIGDKALVDDLFQTYHFDIVVNLAAQAGVRYSIDHPDVYIESNIIGFYNLLEACRHNPVEHLVYASSSSVYGGNKKVPFSTDDKVDNPVSLYAATKKSDELLAHAYSKLYNIPSTGLRFFTVYGPAGRPDMFYYSATKKLVAGKTIQIFNYGDMRRDFTFIDDIVEGVYRVMQGAPEKKNGEDGLPIPPYAVYNIGGGQPENLLDYISTLQEELVRAGVLPADYDFEGHRELVGMQAGDVPVTYADSEALERDYGFTPKIGIREGLRAFAEWYAEYYK
jgi:nucleoside-diphosphate-sugar epimerase